MKTSHVPDIVVAGLSCVDLVISSQIFELGVQNPSEVRMSVGGIGNAISALSGIGVSVGANTRIGRDMFGDYMIGRLREMGADTSGVVIDKILPTGVAAVLNHQDERTPFYAQGAIAAFGLADVPPAYIESSKVFLVFFAGALPSLDGKPMLELVRRCYESGTAVILDLIDKLGADYSPVIDCLPYVNLVVNSVEAQRVTGESDPGKAIEHLYKMAGSKLGNRCLGITSGGGVTMMYESGGSPVVRTIRSPFYGMPVNDVVGAGDAFRAGLAAYISDNHESWLVGNLDWDNAFIRACAVSYLYLSRDRDIRPFSGLDIDRLIERVSVS